MKFYIGKKFGHYQAIRRDDNPGAGGGGGGTPAPSSSPGSAPTASPSPSSTPASSPSTSSNPSEPNSFRYDSDRTPTEAESTRVSGILAKENDPNHRLDFNEIRDLLAFPMKFANPADKEEPGASPDPAAAPAPVVDPNKPVVDPNKPAAPVLDPNVAALVEALTKSGIAAPKAEATKPSETPKPKAYYGETVPAIEVEPGLAQAIFNTENPQQQMQGLNFLVNGIMNRLMEDNATRMLAVSKAMFQQFPKLAQHQITTTSQSQKFYEKNPELNKPVFHETVNAVATAMRKDYANRGIAPPADFADQLANNVHQFLEEQFGTSFRNKGQIQNAPAKPGNQATQQTSPPPAPAVKGKFFTPGNARQESALPNGKATDWRDLVV